MNKYSHLQDPDDSFDFHDRGILDGSQVKQLTEEFVADARRRGLRRVRLVTGRGVHSAGDPVVGPQVRRTLEALRKVGIVERFGDAKVFEGGEGAVDVILSD